MRTTVVVGVLLADLVLYPIHSGSSRPPLQSPPGLAPIQSLPFYRQVVVCKHYCVRVRKTMLPSELLGIEIHLMFGGDECGVMPRSSLELM